MPSRSPSRILIGGPRERSHLPPSIPVRRNSASTFRNASPNVPSPRRPPSCVSLRIEPQRIARPGTTGRSGCFRGWRLRRAFLRRASRFSTDGPPSRSARYLLFLAGGPPRLRKPPQGGSAPRAGHPEAGTPTRPGRRPKKIWRAPRRSRRCSSGPRRAKRQPCQPRRQAVSCACHPPIGRLLQPRQGRDLKRSRGRCWIASEGLVKWRSGDPRAAGP